MSTAFSTAVADFTTALLLAKEVSDVVKSKTDISLTQLIILECLLPHQSGMKRSKIVKATRGIHWDVVTASLGILSHKRWVDASGAVFRITDAGSKALLEAKAKL